MEQIVAFVSEKTGLSPELSRKAVEATLSYLKGRLPAPIAGQLDGLMAGDGNVGLDDVSKAAGGMFAK